MFPLACYSVAMPDEVPVPKKKKRRKRLSPEVRQARAERKRALIVARRERKRERIAEKKRRRAQFQQVFKEMLDNNAGLLRTPVLAHMAFQSPVRKATRKWLDRDYDREHRERAHRASREIERRELHDGEDEISEVNYYLRRRGLPHVNISYDPPLRKVERIQPPPHVVEDPFGEVLYMKRAKKVNKVLETYVAPKVPTLPEAYPYKPVEMMTEEEQNERARTFIKLYEVHGYARAAATACGMTYADLMFVIAQDAILTKKLHIAQLSVAVGLEDLAMEHAQNGHVGMLRFLITRNDSRTQNTNKDGSTTTVNEGAVSKTIDAFTKLIENVDKSHPLTLDVSPSSPKQEDEPAALPSTYVDLTPPPEDNSALEIIASLAARR